MAKKRNTSSILVTGGAGFIGSHLVDRLSEFGHEVTVIDDLSGGYREQVNKKATFFKADIRDWAAMDKIFSKVRPSVVYHLAANAAESKAQFSPVDISSRNYDGSMKVLTAAVRHGVKRFIFTSSIAVYGQLQTPFKESDQPMPEDVYGVTKLAFEESLKILAHVHGFEYLIVRPHNVYGPRQNMRDPYRNVVTIFMNALLRGEPLYLYGDGSQQRCFSFIDDIISALIKGLTLKEINQVFNIGSDIPYTVKELADLIIQISKIGGEIIALPERPREVKVAISDHSLSKKVLGYKDETRLKSGLKKTWQWAAALGPQEPVFTPIEIESPELPVNWRER